MTTRSRPLPRRALAHAHALEHAHAREHARALDLAREHARALDLAQGRARGRILSSLLCALAAASLFGCGHPASREECDEIFNRSAEIELRAQNVTDPKIVAERTAAVRAAKGDELIQKCVGKRITEGAMECVRKATTSEQMDKCLQ